MSDLPRTVLQQIRVEPPKIKGSRHIATLAPVRTEAEARAILADVRAAIPQAGHHAFAWRLGSGGEQVRVGDDGEPAGSAGRPMLAVLEHGAVVQVVAVVSRIFGGTRLGVGGLVRAYSGAVRAALDAAELVVVQEWKRLVIEVPWAAAEVIDRVLPRFEVRGVERAFDPGPRFELEVAERDADGLVAAIRDATAGAARVRLEADDSEFGGSAGGKSNGDG